MKVPGNTTINVIFPGNGIQELTLNCSTVIMIDAESRLHNFFRDTKLDPTSFITKCSSVKIEHGFVNLLNDGNQFKFTSFNITEDENGHWVVNFTLTKLKTNSPVTKRA